MPPNHRQYGDWDSDRFKQWAAKIGENTVAVVECLLSGRKIPEQSYKACMALLKLSDKYSSLRLEAACAKALFYTPHPSFKNVEAILKSGQDKLPDRKNEAPQNTENRGLTRGADYYKRGDN